MTDLRFSSKEIRKVVNLVLIHMDGTRKMTNKARRRLQKKLDAYGLDWHDYVRVRIGDRAGNILRQNFTISDIRAYVKHFTSEPDLPFTVHSLAVSGKKIMDRYGLAPGPMVGRIQREMLNYVLDNGQEVNTIEALFRYADSIIYSPE
jgi:hypothetical protein